MKRCRFPLYATLLLIFVAFSIKAQVVINEISYNPPESGNDSLEYIELYNAGASPVDLNGWHFTKGVVDTLHNVTLNAGEYFVTAINASAMSHVFGITVKEWTSGALSNSGESIVLVDAAENFIDSVAYKDADPWPTDPDGNGPSLELIDAGSDNNDGANWQASGGNTGVIINGFEVSGTPGAANSGGSTGGPEVTIDLANFQFTPKNAVVKVGDLVRWVNGNGDVHNVNGTQAVYPANPADIYSGVPAPGPWQYDYTPALAGLYNYQCDVHVFSGMVGTLGVYDPLTYTDFPLRIIRLTDGVNGDHIYDGVPTTVTGVVHGVNFQPTGYSFYIIQPDNVGINVFSPLAGSYTVQQGDQVKVSGVIDQFNGLLEIVPDAIEVISTGNPLNVARNVNVVTEEDESSYLSAETLLLDSVVVTGSSGYNLYTTSSTDDQILIRVDVDANIPLTPDDFHPGEWIQVYGLGTQFDPSFPYTAGYQILATELYIIIDGLPILPNDALAMNPNPAHDELSFNSNLIINRIELYSLDGQVVKSKVMSSDNGSITLEGMSPGLYVVKAITADGIWTSKVLLSK